MAEKTELDVPETMRLEEAPADPPVAAPEETERPVNPREEAMRRIAANYEAKQRQEEISYGETLAREAAARAPQEEPEAEAEVSAAQPEEQHKPASEPTATDPGAVLAPAPVAEPPPASAPVAPQLRTVNVNGTLLQVTEEQFAHLASMGAVANLAMQQHQQAQAHPVQQQPAPQAQPAAAPIDRAHAEAILHRISYGTPEDGVAALQDLAGHLRSPQVDSAQIRREAVAEAVQHIQLQNDLQTIGTEYPEVFNNQSRALVAAVHLTEIRQRDAALGQQRPSIEQYREACRMVRDAFAPPQPQSGSDAQPTALQAAGIQVAPSSTRLASKRAAPRNPTSVSRAASLGDEAPRPPSASQIVDQIRRSRHQMSMN